MTSSSRMTSPSPPEVALASAPKRRRAFTAYPGVLGLAAAAAVIGMSLSPHASLADVATPAPVAAPDHAVTMLLVGRLDAQAVVTMRVDSEQRKSTCTPSPYDEVRGTTPVTCSTRRGFPAAATSFSIVVTIPDRPAARKTYIYDIAG